MRRGPPACRLGSPPTWRWRTPSRRTPGFPPAGIKAPPSRRRGAPRGYQGASCEAGGAPAVGIVFADGQYWHDGRFPIPRRATRVEATVYYQSLTRHYIEALRDGNVTDDWGTRWHALWEA